jgi:hypothetical protein
LLPTISFGVSRLQQRQVIGTVGDLLEANVLVRKAKEEKFRLVIPALPLDNLLICAVSDASHATMRNRGSQAGHMLVFADRSIREKPSKAALVSWSSHRFRRVVRSTLAAETMGLATAVEHAEFARAAFLEIV